MLKRFAAILVCTLVTAPSAPAQLQRLTVAAASDLHAVLPVVAARFEQTTGATVTVTFGSSGNFFAQIQNGAPFDVFMSADIDYPRRLEQAGLGAPDTLYQYATGRLVLWTRSDSGIDVNRGLGLLADARVRRIAIANPAYAPYGRAAVAALRHEGLYDRVQQKLVLGENISQAAQFAHSGNADVGLVALSLALGPTMKSTGSYVEVPERTHPPIEQAAIAVGRSRQLPLARRFLDLLKQPEIVQILRSYGFTAPRIRGV